MVTFRLKIAIVNILFIITKTYNDTVGKIHEWMNLSQKLIA